MDEMATPAQVAEALHMTEAALAQLRYRGNGPVFARCGRSRVLYRWLDVQKWIEESLHTRTDQPLGPQARSTHPATERPQQKTPNRLGRRNSDEPD